MVDIKLTTHSFGSHKVLLRNHNAVTVCHVGSRVPARTTGKRKMGILNRRTRKGVFEISSGNGLINIYALRRAMGEGGKKPDPKLEALLAHHAQRLKENQEMVQLVKQCQQRVLIQPRVAYRG
jgi:hypothetical protein